MAVNIYLLFDGELKYALEDTKSKFEKLELTTSVGCESDHEINWMVSEHDKEIEKIKIRNKRRIPGKTPKKGKWRTSWHKRPRRISRHHYRGVPHDPSATKDKPGVFAWEIKYKTKSGKKELKLDPGVWVPPPAPKDGYQ